MPTFRDLNGNPLGSGQGLAAPIDAVVGQRSAVNVSEVRAAVMRVKAAGRPLSAEEAAGMPTTRPATAAELAELEPPEPPNPNGGPMDVVGSDDPLIGRIEFGDPHPHAEPILSQRQVPLMLVPQPLRVPLPENFEAGLAELEAAFDAILTQVGDAKLKLQALREAGHIEAMKARALADVQKMLEGMK